jgi:hypothetical protein
MAGAPDEHIDFFISRAGPDLAVARRIAEILERDGNNVLIQDWDFKNRSFMERMHTGLISGARVIALLSPDYLDPGRDHCAAEWQSTLADDPLNRQSRLIVLKIRRCEPAGLLKPLAYCNLIATLADPAGAGSLRDLVLAAVEPGRRKSLPGDLARLFSATRALLHPEIKPTASFTGRDAEMAAIGAALASGAEAAIIQPAAVHGLGGIGKSTLARQYAWDEQARYA